MRQPFVGLVLAAIIGIVVADYFPAISRPILFIAILGALAGLRWSYGPLVFALVVATFFALHSARITSTPADAIDAIRRVAPEAHLHLWQADRADNPYLSYLAAADLLVVTGESESMLAEASATATTTSSTTPGTDGPMPARATTIREAGPHAAPTTPGPQPRGPA